MRRFLPIPFAVLLGALGACDAPSAPAPDAGHSDGGVADAAAQDGVANPDDIAVDDGPGHDVAADSDGAVAEPPARGTVRLRGLGAGPLSAIAAREGCRAEALAREHARTARHNLEYILVKDRSLIKRVPGLALVVAG